MGCSQRNRHQEKLGKVLPDFSFVAQKRILYQKILLRKFILKNSDSELI